MGHGTLTCGSAAQGHTGLGPVSPEPHIQALWPGLPAPGLWPHHPSAFLPAARAALQVRAPRHHSNHAETGAQTWKTNQRVKHQDSECRAGTPAQDHNPNATLLTAGPRGPDGRSRDVRQPCPSSSPFLLWAQGDERPVPLGLLTALGREGPRLPSLLHTPLSRTPAQWAVVSEDPAELRPTDTHSLVGTFPSLSSKGAKPTHLAQLCLPFLPQQKGWLPPFKGRLSRGISPDAAGIRKGSAPHQGPTGPAGTFRGSGAFISSARWARPPSSLSSSPRAGAPGYRNGGTTQRAPMLGCDRPPDSWGVEGSLLKVTGLHRPRA